jgi:hypothetical protein
MKKIKSDATAPAQPETKPSDAKQTEDDNFDNYLANQEAAKQSLLRYPTAFELSQIAAIFGQSDAWKAYWDESQGPQEEYSVAAAAYDLWHHCVTIIRSKIDEDIHYSSLEIPPDPPEWEIALNVETFPMPFEDGLKIIVGKTIRRMDRHKAYRDFIRSILMKKKENAPNIDSMVAEQFARLKSDGFSQKVFRFSATTFSSWKKDQAKEKAKNAAKARWEKK